MKLSIIGLLISSCLSGCTVINETYDENSPKDATTPLESSLMFQQQIQQNLANNNTTNYASVAPTPISNTQNTQNTENRKTVSGEKLNINHYARGLMQDLVANLQYVNSATPVAVTSFVMLDSDYNQSNVLGNQIAESLIHEVHKFGIPVIDFKATGYIRITEQGDFAFSKDYEELTGFLAARYVIGGTMVKHRDGFLVNARVVGLKSKAVVASAQSFIPNEIANALKDKNTDNSLLPNKSLNMKNEPSFSESNEEQKVNNSISLVSN